MTTTSEAARATRELAVSRSKVDDVMGTLRNVEWDLIDAREAAAVGEFREKVESALAWARAVVEDLAELEANAR